MKEVGQATERVRWALVRALVQRNHQRGFVGRSVEAKKIPGAELKHLVVRVGLVKVVAKIDWVKTGFVMAG